MNERDSTIQKLFARHNLGSLPNAPFSNEAALNFINRIRSRLSDLERDLEDKKVAFVISIARFFHHSFTIDAHIL